MRLPILFLLIGLANAACNATIDLFTSTALNQGLRTTLGSYNGAYGEQIFASLKPSVHIRPHGSTALGDIETFTYGSGQCTADSSGLFICSTGTGAYGYGVLRSAYPAVYHPGESIVGRFTMALPTPCDAGDCIVAGGLFATTDGLLIGLKNNIFSVGYQHHGQVEIQTLTIATPASSASTATVTVSGTGVVVSLTVGAAAVNAFEIATALRASLGSAWYFEQVGSTVIATGRSTDAIIGAFSYNAGTTGSAASWSQQASALPKTEVWVNRNDMEYASSITWLNSTAMNIYQIVFGYLGIANIQYMVLNPSTGFFEPMHVLRLANSGTGVSLRNPNLKVGWFAYRIQSGSSNYTIFGGSGQLSRTEIIDEFTVPSWGANVERTGVTNSAQAYLLSVRDMRTFNGNLNNGVLRVILLGAGTDSTKGAVIRVIREPTLTGTPNWQWVSQGRSIAAVDTSASGYTGGSLVYTGGVGASGTLNVDLAPIMIQIPVGEILTFTAQLVSGAASEVDLSITWTEDI